MESPSFKTPTDQHLASLMVHYGVESPMTLKTVGHIEFRVGRENYSVSFHELCGIYGFNEGINTHLRDHNEALYLWSSLGDYQAGGTKVSGLRNPAICYAHKILAHTLFARRETSNIKEDEMCLLIEGLKPFLLKINGVSKITGHPNVNLGAILALKFNEYKGSSRIDALYLQQTGCLAGQVLKAYAYCFHLGSNNETKQGKGKTLDTHQDEDGFSSSPPPIYGSARYQQRQFEAPIKTIADRHAIEGVSLTQRWCKWQDRTIYKLCKSVKGLKQALVPDSDEENEIAPIETEETIQALRRNSISEESSSFDIPMEPTRPSSYERRPTRKRVSSPTPTHTPSSSNPSLQVLESKNPTPSRGENSDESRKKRLWSIFGLRKGYKRRINGVKVQRER
ncbi:unnamed protein product [Arabis nemorensis]|uniref:Arabidopsis retrotransposon Orf1 C-terminal domain-containing protein n=1 Tax=Arabis nemorensis TaxID=586526 RepID=A0A565CBS1_9BRAS|nr:unnamed protein product [Arabis nemorensis]